MVRLSPIPAPRKKKKRTSVDEVDPKPQAKGKAKAQAANSVLKRKGAFVQEDADSPQCSTDSEPVLVSCGRSDLPKKQKLKRSVRFFLLWVCIDRLFIMGM